jgi:hypothetical protein
MRVIYAPVPRCTTVNAFLEKPELLRIQMDGEMPKTHPLKAETRVRFP